MDRRTTPIKVTRELFNVLAYFLGCPIFYIKDNREYNDMLTIDILNFKLNPCDFEN